MIRTRRALFIKHVIRTRESAASGERALTRCADTNALIRTWRFNQLDFELKQQTRSTDGSLSQGAGASGAAIYGAI